MQTDTQVAIWLGVTNTIIAGLTGYAMTGGEFGWTPVVAGLIGAVSGPVIVFVVWPMLCRACRYLTRRSPAAVEKPVAEHPTAVDYRILDMITTLETEGRGIAARDVWMRLTDDSTELVSERLFLLEKEGCFVGKIGPRLYIHGTDSFVREGDIAGLTEKGRAAIAKRRQVMLERPEAKQWRELTARANVLEKRLAGKMESGDPWSDDFSFAWQDFMERLRPFSIPSPNFSSLDPHCMLYLRAYLTSLLVALEAEDLERARTAIDRSSLPLHMKPDPRWKD